MNGIEPVAEFDDEPVVARIEELAAAAAEQAFAGGEISQAEQEVGAAGVPHGDAAEAPTEIEPADRAAYIPLQGAAKVETTAGDIAAWTAEAAQSISPSLQMLSSETADYIKRSAQNQLNLVQSLLKARSPAVVVQIYAEFARTTRAEFIVHSAKIRGAYAKLATDAYKSAAAVTARPT
jgi:hypothetical protein